jgi:preprotein translocase subunit SecG
MSITQIVLSVIIVITSLFLVCVVLLQSGKGDGVAGALSGGADTFLSNHKKNTWDAKLARITKWVSAVFMAAVLILNLVS